MSTATEVQTELIAHERECAIRADSVQRQLDSLTGRIKRLEMLIMGSTATLILGFITILMQHT